MVLPDPGSPNRTIASESAKSLNGRGLAVSAASPSSSHDLGMNIFNEQHVELSVFEF